MPLFMPSFDTHWSRQSQKNRLCEYAFDWYQTMQVGDDVKVIKGVAEGQAAQARVEFEMVAPSISPA